MTPGSTTTSANLRKAAVLVRSLDGETAAMMLAQLSNEEAAAIRAAILELGSVDSDEQADVAAEFRSTSPAIKTHSMGGVELELSSWAGETEPKASRVSSVSLGTSSSAKRFEFLETAPTSALVTYLSREHAQTVAVVVAHLAPARAAAVLAALPDKLQAVTIERLSALGEMDPASVIALERELEAWMATRSENRGTIARRRETMTNILAATDTKTRNGILSKLKSQNAELAEQIAPSDAAVAAVRSSHQSTEKRYESKQATDTSARIRASLANIQHQVASPKFAAPKPAPLPRIEFEKLVHLDVETLTAMMRDVDPSVLAIALAGSGDGLVDRVCRLMPKKTARAFRTQLRQLGPTRLSDMEAAQRVVAEAAARQLSKKHQLASMRG